MHKPRMTITRRAAMTIAAAAVAAFGLAGPAAAQKAKPIKVAAIYTVPVEQQWVSRIHKALNAAKGNQRSQRMLTDSLKWVEQGAKAEQDEYVKTMIEYKVHWEKVLAYRKEHGIEGERPYPHPDDIHVNMATGDIEISGPMTPDEENFISTVQLRVSTRIKIADAEDDLSDHPKSPAKKKHLENLRAVMTKIDSALETHPGRGRFAHIDLSAFTEDILDP